jgi:hypothetical protein
MDLIYMVLKGGNTMKIGILFIAVTVLLAACTSQQPVCNSPYMLHDGACCLDENSDQLCDNLKTEPKPAEDAVKAETPPVIAQAEEKTKTEPPVSKNELPDRNFTLEQLESYIEGISDFPYNFEEENNKEPIVLEALSKNQKLIRSNQAEKNFVIHTFPANSFDTMKDFYTFVKAPKWQYWRYYINETSWILLQPPLTASELKNILPNYDYDQYYRNDEYSTWVDYDIKETPIETSQGTILEYDMESMVMSQFGYWQGNWEPAYLIYKIPCTKDIVIYHKPRWSEYGDTTYANMKKAEVNVQWQRDIERMRIKVINYSESIMRFCGVQKSMYDGVRFTGYSQSVKVVQNWHVFYRTIFNFSFAASFLPGTVVRNGYEKSNISMSFIHYDKTDEGFYRESNLMLKLQYNSSGRITDLDDTYVIPGLGVIYNERYSRNFVEDKSIPLNSTLILWPYFGYLDEPENQKFYIGAPVQLKVG